VEDMSMKSPVPHPELEEVIGARPVHVQRYTFTGALLGAISGFFLTAATQASFTVQPQGGKAVIPIPPDLVITFEFMVLFGVLATFIGFLVGARLPRRGGPLYSRTVSEDQVGLLVEVLEPQYERARDLLLRHKALEIKEERG